MEWKAYTRDDNRLRKALENLEMISVKTKSDEVIGFLRYITDCATRVFIQYILVRPKYQRHGIGMQLMNHAEKEFEKYGKIQVEVLY
ncbi:MAG: GNAT family N-acetyltransferase [Lactobacillales bacterium]|jgi:ribosomal protein S18 acetylase RimI-like enzyme|nr:GNAT family N-acetyltransferase [Lactobacillales bacterium]